MAPAQAGRVSGSDKDAPGSVPDGPGAAPGRRKIALKLPGGAPRGNSCWVRPAVQKTATGRAILATAGSRPRGIWDRPGSVLVRSGNTPRLRRGYAALFAVVKMVLNGRQIF